MARSQQFDPEKDAFNHELVANFLSAAFGSGDYREIAKAVGIVARGQGMSSVARNAHVRRENLYRALKGERTPTLATLIKVLNALGIQLVAIKRRDVARRT
jgi:probable addiction module antidote protein